jgi:hypothetical protein
MIDLTGGQPDLTPELVPWMMKELVKRGLQDSVYLWSDDNLSTDFFWRYLSDVDRSFVAEYPKYGRVCCLKGFDAASFSFNTLATPEHFDSQFDFLRKFSQMGLDLYAYVTLTSPTTESLDERMRCFVDRLQSIDPLLPLRTVPLEIKLFKTMNRRINASTESAMANQHVAVRAWQSELERRFSAAERATPITEVPLVATVSHE